MIDPKELRCGNLVQWGVHHLPVINIFSESKSSYTPYVTLPPPIGIQECHKIEPIPLIEEWLKKFSFGQLSNGEFVLDNFRVVNYNNVDPELKFSFKIKHSDATIYHLADIKFVHQLQNLYFALTQEELTLK